MGVFFMEKLIHTINVYFAFVFDSFSKQNQLLNLSKYFRVLCKKMTQIFMYFKINWCSQTFNFDCQKALL